MKTSVSKVTCRIMGIANANLTETMIHFFVVPICAGVALNQARKMVPKTDNHRRLKKATITLLSK